MRVRQVTRDEVLEMVSQALVGLQVPVFQRGKTVLGAAAEPWSQIHRQVIARSGKEWPDADDYEAFLVEKLEIRR